MSLLRSDQGEASLLLLEAAIDKILVSYTAQERTRTFSDTTKPILEKVRKYGTGFYQNFKMNLDPETLIL